MTANAVRRPRFAGPALIVLALGALTALMAMMAMMAPLATLALIAIKPATVSAIWVAMTLEELVRQSDLIAVGELTSIREQPSSTFDVATIRIQEVIIGKKAEQSPNEVSLAVPPRGRGIAISTSVYYRVGQRGVWFLRKAPAEQGVYLADHPQRLKPAQEADGVRAFVKSRAER